jgi:MinD superfamily P-loop ATPase
MRIAIASGKGGTGKTTVATNLAVVAARQRSGVVYADCDVEEPNGHLFLRPEIEATETVHVLVPKVDRARCTACGSCSAICRYSAIVQVKDQVLLYPELCHSCGGCWLVCPVEAVEPVERPIGELQRGRAGAVRFVQGTLEVGQARSVPLIEAVKAALDDRGGSQVSERPLALLDAPPGTSCPVVETVRGCDYVVLVAEPTPFGLHDLKLAVEMVRTLRLPFGVVVNRASVAPGAMQDYCRGRGIPVLAEIPDDRSLAEAYARGEMIVEALPHYAEVFSRVVARVVEQGEAVS